MALFHTKKKGIASLFFITSLLSACGGGSSESTKKDTTPPVITLKGGDVTIIEGTGYNDLGVTATDAVDGRVDVVISGELNLHTVGEYTLHYTAKDSSGNTASVDRIVTVSAAPAPTYSWVANQFEPAASYKNRCANPRINVRNPFTGKDYQDQQGSVLAENFWLRSWNNNTYLWYKEVTDTNPENYAHPVDYFRQLKSNAIDAQGELIDKYHYAVDTADYIERTEAGVRSGYGISFHISSYQPPRKITVRYIEPNSPADDAGIKRGTQILEVDDIDLVNATFTEFQTIVGNFSTTKIGDTHTLRFINNDAIHAQKVTMTAAEINIQPVQNVEIIVDNESNEKIGYLLFNEHITKAEQPLIDAFNDFKDEKVDDLILDLRYNGGGAAYLASGIAAMISSRATTKDKVFSKSSMNDKHHDIDPFSSEPIQPLPFIYQDRSGKNLPQLGLSRVFIITSEETCSASELIINGLRGIDVEVIQIGSTTCGKPYGFYPTDNCGITYMSVNFKGVNHKGFGDYTNGFSPANEAQTVGVKIAGCYALDDFTHPLGTPEENKIATALAYRKTGVCPTVHARPASAKTSQEGFTIEPEWINNAIMGNGY